MGTRDDEYDYLFKGKFLFTPNKWKWRRRFKQSIESEGRSEEVH